MHHYGRIVLTDDGADLETVKLSIDDGWVDVDFRYPAVAPSTHRQTAITVGMSTAHAEHLYDELGKVLGKIPMAQEIS